MTRSLSDKEEEALSWVVRLRDIDFDRWEDFESWLAADCANATAYYALAEADHRLDAMLRPTTAGDTAPAHPSRRRLRPFLAGGIAAALTALIVGSVLIQRPNAYAVRTAPGERREVVLSTGTTIAMNGATTVRLRHENPHVAEVVEGEAHFSVRHDPERPFQVIMGEDKLVDIGTRFDVFRSANRAEIAVAEGAVRYDVPTSRSVTLGPGEALRVDRKTATAVKFRVAPDQVGSWRAGRFIYDGEPLSRVAVDLSRYVGVKIAVAPDIAGEQFRGAISVQDPRHLERLGPLFRARLQRQGAGWLISRP